MLGNIAEQNTHVSAIVGLNDGRTVIAGIDETNAYNLRNIAPGDPVCLEPPADHASPYGLLITDRAPCQYFRKYWDGDSGGPCSGWGGSTYLFEVHADGCVARQIQLFNDGRFLLYDEICAEDEYGGRSTEPLDLSEFEQFRVTKDAFFERWDPDASVNRGLHDRGS